MLAHPPLRRQVVAGVSERQHRPRHRVGAHRVRGYGELFADLCGYGARDCGREAGAGDLKWSGVGERVGRGGLRRRLGKNEGVRKWGRSAERGEGQRWVG